MSQQSIKVDAGSGSPVDFSLLNGGTNYRQAVTIGDAGVDANYVTVQDGNLFVKNTQGTIQFTNSTITANQGTSPWIVQYTNATIQATNSTISAVGDVASGVSDSGNPVKVGFVARTALPTAVSDSQRVNSYGDKFGRQVVIPQATRDLVSSQYTSVTNINENTIVSAQGAGVFADIASLIISNTSGTAVSADIKDVFGGSIIKSYEIPALDMRGGVFTVPWPQTTANSGWTITLSTTVTAKVAVEFIKNK